jgi:vacuole morphology and inheritance protein 14
MSTKEISSSNATANASELPIQLSISRNLSDKLYEKRKLGALEVEQLIKELNNLKDEDRINNVINHLVTNFSDSTQGNHRKGGLIALAAIAIGLGVISFSLNYVSCFS